jgi:hypothetical protein
MSGIRSAFEVGRNEFAVTGFVPYFRKVEIAFEDLDANLEFKIPVQAGTFILGAGVRVEAAFDGNLPVLLMGRSGDPDGFLVSGNVALTTPNSFYYSGGGANADAQGRYFAAADYILVDVNYTTTAPTAGALTVLLHEFAVDAGTRGQPGWRESGEIGQDYPTYSAPGVS